MLVDVGIHPMKGSLDLWLEEGIEFLEEGLKMGEVIVQKVGIFILIVLGQLLVHAECAQWPAA